MSNLDKRRAAPLEPGTRSALRFRTASGEVVEAKPGKRVKLDDVARMVDICIVFDTTGSMLDKLDGLVRCMVDFVADLDRLGLDWRLSAVPFGDLTVPGDRVDGNLPFVTQRRDAEQMIRRLPRFAGGGNLGESSLEAMEAAIAKPYRRGAVRILVALTDEPPLQGPQLTSRFITRQLQSQEFVCFVASPRGQGYEEWAHHTGGKWYAISATMDTAGILSFLRGLLRGVVAVSRAVHDIGDGSVKKYLESGFRPKELEG